MDWIVGHDLTEHGDDALRAALVIAAGGEAPSIGVVHVVTQRALDETGGLSAAEKEARAIETLYPTIWRRIAAAREALRGDSDQDGDPDIDVLVRFAPVHLTRVEERIANEILRVAVDFGAPAILLGRRGRPDSVAEHIASKGTIEGLPGEPRGVIRVRVDPATLAIASSSTYRSGAQ